jgi:carbon storage regulator
MLVLTRRESEKILIGDDIELTVVRIDGNKVRIGIKAPDHVTIKRDELPPGNRPQLKSPNGETVPV